MGLGSPLKVFLIVAFLLAAGCSTGQIDRRFQVTYLPNSSNLIESAGPDFASDPFTDLQFDMQGPALTDLSNQIPEYDGVASNAVDLRIRVIDRTTKKIFYIQKDGSIYFDGKVIDPPDAQIESALIEINQIKIVK